MNLRKKKAHIQPGQPGSAAVASKHGEVPVANGETKKPVVEMDGIYKAYGKGEGQVQVLKNVSLCINPGDFVAILGPSGSGKTTLMNLIGLIDTPDEGRYLLDGINTSRLPDQEYARLRNRKIGFVFQKFNLIAKHTALRNVALPLLISGAHRRDANKAALKTLHYVGLGDRWHHRPSQLSGGQQQRVAIARALVGSSPLILADEPTGALDQKTGHEILDFFCHLNQEGKTIVLITHDPAVAARASRMIRVEDGQILDHIAP